MDSRRVFCDRSAHGPAPTGSPRASDARRGAIASEGVDRLAQRRIRLECVEGMRLPSVLAGKHDRCVIAGDGRSSGRLRLGADTCHQIAHANIGEHYSHPFGPFADAHGKHPATGSSHEHCHDRTTYQHSHARTRRTHGGADAESW